MPEEPGRSTPDIPRDPGFVASPLWWAELDRNDLPLEGRLQTPQPVTPQRRGSAVGLPGVALVACILLVAALTVVLLFGIAVLLACVALGFATAGASLVNRRRQ